MTVGEPWFWWHLEMVKTEISKRTKKPIIHNSTISRRLIHLKFVVEKLRATRFWKKQFEIGVIQFYITDRGTAAVAPWVQRGFNVGSTWRACNSDRASFQGAFIVYTSDHVLLQSFVYFTLNRCIQLKVCWAFWYDWWDLLHKYKHSKWFCKF